MPYQAMYNLEHHHLQVIPVLVMIWTCLVPRSLPVHVGFLKDNLMQKSPPFLFIWTTIWCLHHSSRLLTFWKISPLNLTLSTGAVKVFKKSSKYCMNSRTQIMLICFWELEFNCMSYMENISVNKDITTSLRWMFIATLQMEAGKQCQPQCLNLLGIQLKPKLIKPSWRSSSTRK